MIDEMLFADHTAMDREARERQKRLEACTVLCTHCRRGYRETQEEGTGAW